MAAVGALTLVGVLIVPGSPASGAEPFVNGTAFATAAVSRVAPGVGDLSLAITGGIATAEVRNQLAQAQAQSADLGLIGSSLTAAPCDGGNASIRPEQLPQPTRVDNRKGDAAAKSDEIPIAGATLGGGHEEARATRQPLSQALSTSIAGDFGLVKLGGGRAESTTRVIDNAAREALATSEGSIDIAGVVKLTGLKWTARHRTGAGAVAAGTFELGSAAAFGAPLSTSQLEPLEAAVNTALALSGIRVEFPQIERFTEPADLVRVTPLRVIIEDSPIGSMALGPVLSATRAQREQLFTEIVKRYCRSSSLLLVGDITLSVASGTGFLALEFGGAEATTAARTFENPFGSGGAGFMPSFGAIPGVPAIEAAPGFVLTGPPAPPTNVGGASTSIINASGPLRERCESIHSFGGSCSKGSAVTLGLIGLAAVIAIATLDWQRQRRARSTLA
ncbi:MAG TPA: hypothetical protein VNB24_02470 [Acidimicrobiales bacterium]|nr:hypothetical protein [Acidimicrobiales bacterium]